MRDKQAQFPKSGSHFFYNSFQQFENLKRLLRNKIQSYVLECFLYIRNYLKILGVIHKLHWQDPTYPYHTA